MIIESATQYASLARRTQRHFFKKSKLLEHATWGFASEISEVVRAFVKQNNASIKDESGDVCWFIVELFDALNLKPFTDEEISDNIVNLVGELRAQYVDAPDKIGNCCLVNLQLIMGNVLGFLQKSLQGHPLDRDITRKQLISVFSLLVMLNNGENIVKLYEIMAYNIDKLVRRYPNGFSVERSLNREEEAD